VPPTHALNVGHKNWTINIENNTHVDGLKLVGTIKLCFFIILHSNNLNWKDVNITFKIIYLFVNAIFKFVILHSHELELK
jgi:hypothetical protein